MKYWFVLIAYSHLTAESLRLHVWLYTTSHRPVALDWIECRYEWNETRQRLKHVFIFVTFLSHSSLLLPFIQQMAKRRVLIQPSLCILLNTNYQWIRVLHAYLCGMQYCTSIEKAVVGGFGCFVFVLASPQRSSPPVEPAKPLLGSSFGAKAFCVHKTDACIVPDHYTSRIRDISPLKSSFCHHCQIMPTWVDVVRGKWKFWLNTDTQWIPIVFVFTTRCVWVSALFLWLFVFLPFSKIALRSSCCDSWALKKLTYWEPADELLDYSPLSTVVSILILTIKILVVVAPAGD